MRDNHVKNLSLIDELRLTNMAKLTKKEQEKIKLEEEKNQKIDKPYKSIEKRKVMKLISHCHLIVLL